MEEVNEFKSTLANNLVAYRKKNNMTQFYVGQAINYSDKAISKWERGENTPEISALYELSKLYKCSISDLLGEKSSCKEKSVNKKQLSAYQRISITLMSILGLWFLSIMTYMFLSSFVPVIFPLWLIFIYTIPLTFVVMLVFNCIWGNSMFLPWIISLFVWGIALSIYLSFDFRNKWLLFVIVGVLQLIAFIWYSMLINNKKNKNKQNLSANL